MQRPLRKVDLESVRLQNYLNRSYISKCKKVIEDKDKDKRLKAQECPVCYYGNNMKIGGSAMTSSPCGICEKEMGFCSTCVDKLCPECAEKHRLCKHCGGDIDCKNRNKL